MNRLSNRLTIETHNGKQIVFVDYKGLKEKEMIELVNKHLELTLQMKLPFLADFHKTYVTPSYIIQARRFAESTKQIIDKGAPTGASFRLCPSRHEITTKKELMASGF